MDKTIWNLRTPINLDIIQLPKKMNKLRDDNLDLIQFPNKLNRLRRARIAKTKSPTQTKSLKPKQFELTLYK
jgi:hypothetical protein